MKTVSQSEYEEVLSSSNDLAVAGLPPKIDDYQGQNIVDQGKKPEVINSKSDIKCNSNLTSSVDRVKSSKINPGHYLQKVLFPNKSIQKVKSQSLPSCMSDDNCLSDVSDSVNNSIENNKKINQGSLCSLNSRVKLKFVNTNSEKWFKTWPERGFDKKYCKHDDAYRTNNQTCFNKNSVVNNNTLVVKSKEQDNAVVTNHLTRNPPKLLNEVLESITPLGYNPVTKQLHVIKPFSETEVVRDMVESNTTNINKDNFKVDASIIGSNNFCLKNNTISREKDGSANITSGSNDIVKLGLIRVATDVSCCSYSSTVSSLSDVSPTANEDSASSSLPIADHGDNCSLASVGECSILSEDSTLAAVNVSSVKQKKGITEFFSRNVFNWKGTSREDGNATTGHWQNHLNVFPNSGHGTSSDTLGWKIFSRSNNAVSECLTAGRGYESGGGSVSPSPGSPCSIRSSGSISVGTGTRVCSHENIIASSTALIQLDRPSNLPAKSQEESEKHRQQYSDMVVAVKKKELKEAKQRQKQLKKQLKLEEQQAQAARTWTQEILPKWNAVCNSRKVRDLWWLGIPPCVRGRVWRLAIGNEMNVTKQLYEICCQRVQDMLNMMEVSSDDSLDNKEASVQSIQLDISRTFPNLCIFQQGGPYYDMLHCLLGAYVCYRPDIGYVQGMSFIAAVLILNMDVSDAFICFANLLNRPCHMAFFSLNQSMMQAYYATYNDIFCENLPHIHKHFIDSNLTPDLYLLDWIYTVFAKAMNLDLASRIWDVFLRDGEEFIFRAALGILHLCQDNLLKMDFVHGSQYLTKLPEDLPAEQLFKSIAGIKMSVGKQNFYQILAFHLQQRHC